MTFFFSLPQSLLRQLSINFESDETEYVFVPESKSSKTGRDNKENFEISKEILKATLPNASLSTHTSAKPPVIKEKDGIGEELLRIKPYEWILATNCKYVVQHSCFGWESISARALFHPNLLLRGIVRTKKLYRRNKFAKIYVYAGISAKKMRHSIKPWQKISIIQHEDLAEICKKASVINKLSSSCDLSGNEQDRILIIASGDFTDLYQEISHSSSFLYSQIIIKLHPQQESYLPDFLDSRSFTVQSRSVPAELVIEKYKPKVVYGVQSTVQYYAHEKYKIYTPKNWRYSQESELLAKYRLVLDQPKFRFFRRLGTHHK